MEQLEGGLRALEITLDDDALRRLDEIFPARAAPRPRLTPGSAALRLGFYTLAGAPQSPRDLIDEVHDGERLGLGAVFISERFNIKEAATLSGAVGAVSSTHRRSPPAATNHNTRHPIVTASYATTMHRLTGGRFTLGLGRGIDPMFDALGLRSDHHRAARGLRRAHAPAVAGRDDPRPRRAGGTLPVPPPRPDVRRGHPARARGLRPEHAARSAAARSTRWCCTRSSPTRRSSAACATVKDAGRAGRPRSRRRSRSGRASRRSATTCPTTSG